MARRTYEAVSENVIEKLGNRSEVTPDKIDQWVNDALLWVANHFEHKELQGLYQETLIAGQYAFVPAISELWWTVSFQNMRTGKFLEPDAYENIRHRLDTTALNGPQRYVHWGDTVYVTPAPQTDDINISVRYLKKPVRWTTGESPLTEVYDPILELHATGAGYEHFRLFDMRDQVLGRAVQYAVDMRLPVIQEKKDDFKAGWRPPRLRWR